MRLPPTRERVKKPESEKWASGKEEPAKELESGVCRFRGASRGRAQRLEV